MEHNKRIKNVSPLRGATGPFALRSNVPLCGRYAALI